MSVVGYPKKGSPFSTKQKQAVLPILKFSALLKTVSQSQLRIEPTVSNYQVFRNFSFLPLINIDTNSAQKS